MAGNPACKKKEHKMHICALKESGFDKKNPEKFKALIAGPGYSCDTCGAKAKKSDNLCKPVRL
jgi:hypothetical protein